MRYSKVSIFGTGLIGGAVGRGIIAGGLAGEVCGWGRNPARLKLAAEFGTCSVYTTDISEAASGAEVIILATPPSVIIRILGELRPFLSEGMLLMDVGSVKSAITRKAEELDIRGTGAEFVGCHPMSGSEKTGFENSFEGMFEGAPCIITPVPENTPEMVAKAADFWKTLGARVIFSEPENHDLAAGLLSHLPHALSSALALCVFSRMGKSEISDTAGRSFLDMTRVAGASSEMWADIYLLNSPNVIAGLDGLQEHLSDFRRALSSGNRAEIEDFLKKAAEYTGSLYE